VSNANLRGGCHQPHQHYSDNQHTGSLPALVGSPSDAPRLSKTLELIADKGNITKKH